jgi:hypothetical protein
MHCLKLKQNNSCRIAISFGWTVPQLFAGKSVTRRCWKDSYGQQFIKRWQRGITTYIALDKNWRQGRKQIGWITLTCCPYKERLSEMLRLDVAAEGFPELTPQEFIQRFFKGDDQQQVWVVRFRFTPLSEESCTTGIVSKLDIEKNTEDVSNSPGGNDCSSGAFVKRLPSGRTPVISPEERLRQRNHSSDAHQETLGSRNLDIAIDTDNINSNPSGKNCSTRISRNLDIAIDTENTYSFPESCSTRISRNLDIAIDTESVNSNPGGKSCSAGIAGNLDIADNTENVSTFFGKDCSAGIVPNLDIADNTENISNSSVEKSCSAGIVQNLHIALDIENVDSFSIRKDCSALGGEKPCEIAIEHQSANLTNRKISEVSGQLLIKSDDELNYRGEFESVEEFEKALTQCPLQSLQLEKAVRQSGTELQLIPAEQKIHIPAEQHNQTETIKPRKARDTKPGRGSRPKQTKCNVKRNGQENKAANTYWLYQFSFKVDGKYYNRSCSIPKEKVKRVIEMWESKQYSWQDIIEYIGKNSDKIVDKLRGK